MGVFGGPPYRVGDLFNFFVHPLSKLCVSGFMIFFIEVLYQHVLLFLFFYFI